MPDTQSTRTPPQRLLKIAWTFDLSGPCIYCGKNAARSRTFHASTQNDAAAQADAATKGLCHRKCGGY